MSSKNTRQVRIKPYKGPVGGWGSVRGVTEILLREAIPLKGSLALWHQNKPGGFACVSCSYGRPPHLSAFEFCENGAKATAWEITDKRCPPAFFAEHTVTELESWSDLQLEEVGRLTEPMRWDSVSDRYVPISWADAFAAIGAHLNALAPKSVVFYTSGRASLEASYMYQLLARMYGNNNLPDSSNMCHESTSVALPQTIGVPVGTVKIEDFEHTDCVMFFGQNVGVNSPRMLHQLQEVRERGVPIITFNPLRERGLESFTNPQSPIEMLTLSETKISTQYHQLQPGSDLAVLVGMSKALLAMDDEAKAAGNERVIDVDFIEQDTSGFDAFVASMDHFQWPEIEACSGFSSRRHRIGGERLWQRQGRYHLLWHGPDTAPFGGARDPDAEQFAAHARQYRQARGRHLSGARPFECPGPAHGRDHGKARARPARSSRRAVRF